MMFDTLMKQYVCVVMMLCGVLFLSSNVAQAQTVNLAPDLATWQSWVFGEQLFETTANNVGLADELSSSPGVSSPPGVNAKVGGVLTFLKNDIASTGVTRGFMVESLQFIEDVADPDFNIERGFTFDDHDGGNPVTDSSNALSVGDTDDFEDDDWSLMLLDGAMINAFGVELRDNKFERNESISIFSGTTLKNVIDLSSLADGSDSRDFLGITTDYFFDRIVFDEDPVGVLPPFSGDDIAIADFRFATVVPEPVSSTLFVIGGVAFGLRSWRKKKMNA